MKISPEEGKKVEDSIKNLRSKYQQKVCKHCGAPIVFDKSDDGRFIPHNLDGTPHWTACPYSGFTQKKKALPILEKISLYLAIKHENLDFTSEVGLSEEECKIIHAILEKAFRKASEEAKSQPVESREVRLESEDAIPFKVAPTDPAGDPDEDRAPDEEAIEAASSLELSKESQERLAAEQEKVDKKSYEAVQSVVHRLNDHASKNDEFEESKKDSKDSE